MEKTKKEDLPEELKPYLAKTEYIIRSYLAAIEFLTKDSARDPTFSSKHFLTYLYFDFMQSALAIAMLLNEGLINTAKREIRYLIELSIKVSVVHENNYHASIEEKLAAFNSQLESTNISINKRLLLQMLPAALHAEFREEVGRIYGETSSYVHLTPKQIKERMEAVDSGFMPGKESPEEVASFNNLLSRGLACSLVFVMHGLPEFATGDWLVEDDGLTNKWYFVKSRFIGGIDSHFDYKAERAKILEKIDDTRAKEIEF